MAPTKNLSWVFLEPPIYEPVDGKNFHIEDHPFDLEAPPPNGGLVVEVLYVSVDPYMRGRMRDPSIKSYSPPFEIGQPIKAYSIARVVKSDSGKWKEGDIFFGTLPVQQHIAIDEDMASGKIGNLRKVENPYNLPLREFVGALGMPGLTAYSSLYEIGKPKKGETIFISSAAGAVGQLVGQLAKHDGLRVIGSVGSDDKLDFILKELGFDGGFNYKKEKPANALPRLAPNGIDIYYENVGAEHLEAAINALNVGGRIVACGMVAEYNTPLEERYGVKNLFKIIGQRLRIQGFIVGDPDFGPKYTKEHQSNVQRWLHEGTFKSTYHQTDGLENVGAAFVEMLKGGNFGKAAVKVKD
ncbi:MAG: hypothetical protein Q9227_000212 [Pyrenula ochraceoflavens]